MRNHSSSFAFSCFGAVAFLACGPGPVTPTDAAGDTVDVVSFDVAADASRSPDVAADASTPPDAAADSGPQDSAAEAGGCPSVAYASAPVVTVQTSHSAPPVAAGFMGVTAIANGTYFLTGATFYDGPDGGQLSSMQDQWVLQNSGNGFAGAINEVVPSNGVQQISGTFTATGTTFMESQTCPAGALPPPTYSFTATSTILTLIQTQSEGTFVESFTLQP